MHAPVRQMLPSGDVTAAAVAWRATGSPRDNVRRYKDAMSIVRKKGKPSYFITVTPPPPPPPPPPPGRDRRVKRASHACAHGRR